MAFPQSVSDKALAASGRYCCICHKFCGTKIELHHIKQVAYGGEDTFDNCIPLCFDCHADMGKADPTHNRGKRYTESELKIHRDNWYKTVSEKRTLDYNGSFSSVAKNDTVITTSELTYTTPQYRGSFTFDYSNNNGEFTIGKGERQFTTKWSKASDKSIHAYKDASNIDSIARIKAPCELANELHGEFDFSSRCRTPNIGDIILWKNKNGKYAATKIIAISDDTRGADHDELTCEYIVYS